VRLSGGPQHHPPGGAQSAGKAAAEETRIDTAARQKIASQRKIILEGSQEWDILYRKYYNDEVKKLGPVEQAEGTVLTFVQHFSNSRSTSARRLYALSINSLAS
jgi:hypothetical protein